MAGRVRGLLERVLAAHRAPPGAGDGATDAELLRRFARERDPIAFELLVWRHGAAVLGVCRRALRDEHAAEDAFQAAFLVLACKAGAVRGNVGGWLFKVARRVAARAAARRGPVLPPVERAVAPAPDPVERAELADLLDAEIVRLPERLRRAVVLCYLGGRTAEDAARELNCPRGTVLSRLAAARARLAARLARHGLALPATVAGTVGAPLVSSVAAALHPGAVAVPAVSELATEVLRAMNRFSALTAFGGLALVASLAGAGALAAGPGGAGDGPPAPGARPANAPPPAPPRGGAPAAPPAAERADPELVQQLEARAAALKQHLATIESEIERLSARGTGDVERKARLTKQVADLEDELRLSTRELSKLEVEVQVLRKLLAEKLEQQPNDAALAELAVRDPEVQRLKEAHRKARGDLEAASNRKADVAILRALGADVVATETALAERTTGAMRAAREAAREKATGATAERFERAVTELRIKQLVRQQLQAELQSEAKRLDQLGSGAALLDRLQDSRAKAIESLRDIEAQLARLRATSRPAPAANDDKLDLILRELAALRQEVRELKAQRK